MRLLPLIVMAAVAVGTADAAMKSYLIQTSASFQRLGDYRISDDPDYDGALRALGSSSSCRLVDGDATHAVATWDGIGVTMELRTYGGIPGGKTGCTEPARIHVHTARAAGGRWYTSFGLRVGHSVARLKRLYPRAKATKGVPEWYRRGYWLVTRRGTCLGLCGDRLFATLPVLVAETRDGRVTSFVVVVGAEGE